MRQVKANEAAKITLPNNGTRIDQLTIAEVDKTIKAREHNNYRNEWTIEVTTPDSSYREFVLYEDAMARGYENGMSVRVTRKIMDLPEWDGVTFSEEFLNTIIADHFRK